MSTPKAAGGREFATTMSTPKAAAGRDGAGEGLEGWWLRGCRVWMLEGLGGGKCCYREVFSSSRSVGNSVAAGRDGATSPPKAAGGREFAATLSTPKAGAGMLRRVLGRRVKRSEEHTSELQSR